MKNKWLDTYRHNKNSQDMHYGEELGLRQDWTKLQRLGKGMEHAVNLADQVQTSLVVAQSKVAQVEVDKRKLTCID